MKASAGHGATVKLAAWREDPLSFIAEQLPGVPLWSAMRMIIESVWKHQRTSVRACHGISKTITGALVGVAFLNIFPRSIVITSAPTNRQVKDLLWKEIGAFYEKNPHLAGDCKQMRIPVGPEWFMLGFSTDYATNVEGYHAPAILWILDEGKGLPAWLYNSIEGSLTGGFARVLELSTTDGADQQCPFRRHHTTERTNWNSIHLSAFDSPFVDPERYSEYETYKNKDLYRYGKPKKGTEWPLGMASEIQIADEAWIDDRIEDWKEDEPDLFETKVGGQFPLQGADNLIPLKWVESAVNAAVKEKDYYTYGEDVAAMGDDETVLFKRRGGRFYPAEVWTKKDTMETVGLTRARLKQDGIEPRDYPVRGEIHIDSIGLGQGVADRLSEDGYPVVRVISSLKPYYGEGIFKNHRSEMWWNARERFKEQYKTGGVLSIPDDPKLIEELTGIKFKRMSDGLIMVERKEDYKKRLKRSPDRGDAFVYCLFEYPETGREDGYISSEETIEGIYI